MILSPRRLLIVILCCAVVFLALLAALGESTGNTGLWTLGGTVGMARGTIVCFLLLAIAILLGAFNGNSGPFVKQ